MVSAYVRAGAGSDVAMRYGIRGFPSMIFVGGDGKVVCRAFRTFSHPDDAVEPIAPCSG